MNVIFEEEINKKVTILFSVRVISEIVLVDEFYFHFGIERSRRNHRL